MRKKMTKNKNSLLNKFLLLICIALFITAILIKTSCAIRPILCIIAIAILAFYFKKNTNYTRSKIIIISLVLLGISIIADGIIVYTFKRIPIFTYNIIQKENVIVYSSLGIRVWQCNKDDYNNIIVDPFYKKGYMCNVNDIETLDINTFLNFVVQNHNEYKNHYVKIKGKISKKSGINSIEMRPYTTTDIKVNGYVEFADNIILKVLFKENEINLDSYDVYDEITIIGIVKNIENTESNHIIYMSDSILVGSINLNEYTLSTIKSKKCNNESTLLYSNKEYNLYKHCLDEIIITFPDGQYELTSALSSSKLNINALYKESKNEEINEDNSVIYRFDDYSILVCNPSYSKDIYIGNSKMKFENVKCNEIVTK